MEELGLDPLGSLPSDLASYLDGSGFVGAGLEQPFLGDLEAIANRLELPSFDDAQDAQEIKLEDLPSTSNAALISQDEEDDTAAGRTGTTKRRRRTRTERQQVLNRLAQQRYRQRKKEKVQALQSTVGCLQSQLDRLSFLEAENTELRATTQQLGEQLASKDAALLHVQQQLRQTGFALRAQQERCAAHERQIAEQQQTVEAQRQQLRCSTFAGLDPQALSDRLLSIVKEALADAAAQGAFADHGSNGVTAASSSSSGSAPFGSASAAPSSSSSPSAQQQQQSAASMAAASLLLSDAVVQRISRTLTSCCRELVYATKGKQGAAAAAADTPSAIPVSCC
ncbi:hypothetical protein Agub_g14757 [Astrephomene gubernaculifera]|uniref:BZIP domain-containing protein n=1 Tax=Astrephomene gubernaculifera TaxID=47775 RepID=A0AAD3E610_9CHLO|nr:hypothetical protein Agub_g14757 [Astrephomene gubernaculifera]